MSTPTWSIIIVCIFFVVGTLGFLFWMPVSTLYKMHEIDKEIEASKAKLEDANARITEEFPRTYPDFEQTLPVKKEIEEMGLELQTRLEKAGARGDVQKEKGIINDFVKQGGISKLKTALAEYNHFLEEEYPSVVKEHADLKIDLSDVSEDRRIISWEESAFMNQSMDSVFLILLDIEQKLFENTRYFK